MHNIICGLNKRQRIPKEQSKIDNREKQVTQGTQDSDKQKHHAICVRHYFTQANTTNVNKTRALL